MRKRRLPEVAVFGFLLPNFPGFCAFLPLPILLSLVMSLTNWSLKPSQELEYVGLRNFTDLLGVRAIGRGDPALAADVAARRGVLPMGSRWPILPRRSANFLQGRRMPQQRILAIEDEEDIQEVLAFNLRKEGYAVECVGTGEEGLQRARLGNVDLILLDLMLPGMDGLAVCRELRSDPATKDITVIIVTAKGEEADIIVGLELGADDYVTKPFLPKVLIARVRAVLRRSSRPAPSESETVRSGEVVIRPDRHEVLVCGKAVDLTATEFGILHMLARRPGRVYTRYQIVDGVRGTDYPVTDRSVDVHIVALRRKLGPVGKYIETVRGVGYRFKE